MALRPTALERAFELARSGEFTGVSDLKKRLSSEGYFDADRQLYGAGLTKQLRTICLEARAQRTSSTPGK